MSAVRRIVLLLAAVGLMQAVPASVHLAAETDPRIRAATLTLGVGFVLVASWLMGKLAAEIRLPKLTGYLATGILAGPAVLDFLNQSTVEGLALVNGAATALIALTAGSEMDFRSMRPLFRSIGWVSLIAVVGTVGLLYVALLAVRSFIPFLSALPLAPDGLLVALVLAVVLVAQSPAVVVALRAETGADGPVARTVLGVVVLADLLVLVLFAVSSAAAEGALAGEIDVGSAAARVAWELFGSLGVGTAIGVIFSVWLRLVGTQGLDLFVLAVCVVAAEIGRRVHLDPLLMLLAAGMWVENFSHSGERLRHAFEDASLPVYIVFFTVAGAVIVVDIPVVALLPLAVIVVVRAVGLTGGTWLAARVAGAPPAVGAYGGIGLLPQAGLAIALAMLFGRTFPEFGSEASTLVLQVVTVNQLIAPALMRWSLVRAGEATGAASHSLGEQPATDVTPPEPAEAAEAEPAVPEPAAPEP